MEQWYDVVYVLYKIGLQARWGSDLDCQIQRPKNPRTALPSDVRSKLGLKQRKGFQRKETALLHPTPSSTTKLLDRSSCGNKNQSQQTCSKGLIQIKKQPYLRKGSGIHGSSSTTDVMKMKHALAISSQTLAWR